MAERLPRLRQVALVAGDLESTCRLIEAGLGLRNPFHDPGVAEFGLANAVYEVGDTFLEVVSPVIEGTTAGRYLQRRGGDAGYMALFQVADTPTMRTRVADLGLRAVWQIDLPDISGTHLHPQDVRGAIVSFDTPVIEEAWRWAGPRWEKGAPPDLGLLRITRVVVRVVDIDAASARWTALFGDRDVRFEAAERTNDEGISAVELAGFEGAVSICGVTFRAPT
jgi:hypothetical protein